MKIILEGQEDILVCAYCLYRYKDYLPYHHITLALTRDSFRIYDDDMVDSMSNDEHLHLIKRKIDINNVTKIVCSEIKSHDFKELIKMTLYGKNQVLATLFILKEDELSLKKFLKECKRLGKKIQ